MGSSIFYSTACFRCILYSILLLIKITFLLFTIHFYDKDLGMMTFLSLHVNAINIKGNFLNKLSIKCCTSPHVLIFFCPLLLLFISVILLLHFRDIETNPGPDSDYLNKYSFCHWNLNSIAAHNSIKMSLLQV